MYMVPVNSIAYAYLNKFHLYGKQEIWCSRDARKPISVFVHKLSIYLQPFRRSSILECALQPKIAKIN